MWNKGATRKLFLFSFISNWLQNFDFCINSISTLKSNYIYSKFCNKTKWCQNRELYLKMWCSGCVDLDVVDYGALKKP